MIDLTTECGDSPEDENIDGLIKEEARSMKALRAAKDFNSIQRKILGLQKESLIMDEFKKALPENSEYQIASLLVE